MNEISIELKKELQDAEQGVQNYLARLNMDKIANESQLNTATAYLTTVKGKIKEFETEQKKITKPLDEAKKSVMNLFRPALDALKLAEVTVKAQITTYILAQEKIRQEKEKQLNDQLKANARPGDIVPEINIPQAQAPQGITMKKHWTFRIKNENEIPRQYLIPNDKMIQDTAVNSQGTAQIPGIEFYQEDILAASSK